MSPSFDLPCHGPLLPWSSMHPLVGLDFSGATLTPHDDLMPGSGALGRPVWGPIGLLRDLELRLALPEPAHAESLRVLRWAARVRELSPRGRYYSRSFELDPIGTAAALLELRDALVEGGWDRRPIDGGGVRVEAIAELEALPSPGIPDGVADRVLAVAREAEQRCSRLYEALTLGEPRSCWPAVWQRVFRALEVSGTRVEVLGDPEGCAPSDSDLGKVQRALDGESPGPLVGDGSFLVLEAETSIEAAHAAALLLAVDPSQDSVVVRERDGSELDAALEHQGMPTLGVRLGSRSRALLQLLPLALELAFEPKDPERALELLMLPGGPFQGAIGRFLARALFRAPGIGGRPWEEAKARLPEPRDATLARVAEWFEQTGADALDGAAPDDLLRVVSRVREWLVAELPRAPEDPVRLVALSQCDAFALALSEGGAERLDLVTTRRLLDLVRERVTAESSPELSGRVASVTSPLALRVSRPNVLWWSFVHSGERPWTPPFRLGELRVLEGAGVRFPDPTDLLRRRAAGYRRVARLARRRLVLVVPRRASGEILRPHPLWDEIVARVGLDAVTTPRVTSGIGELLTGNHGVRASELSALPLPAPLPEWRIRMPEPPTFERHSSSSLSALLACPLRWALQYLGRIESEQRDLPAQHQLSGTLGHRLVEELHAVGAFAQSSSQVRTRAEQIIDGLIEREGAVLLQRGKAHERAQLRRQLVDGVVALAEALHANGLEVDSVEEPFEVAWGGAVLNGRWDLRVRDRSGRRLVIDLKWGRSTYAGHLSDGTALQLAAYVHALERDGAAADGAYFSLKARRMIALSSTGLRARDLVTGPPLAQTWRRVNETLPLAQRAVLDGTLPVTGVARSKSLLEALDVAPDDPRHYGVPAKGGCDYCAYDGLCGRRWEDLS